MIALHGYHHLNTPQIYSNHQSGSTIMSVLLIVGPKCTLAASHMLAPDDYGEYADGTDRQTDVRQTVTLCFPLYAASHTGLPTVDLKRPKNRCM